MTAPFTDLELCRNDQADGKNRTQPAAGPVPVHYTNTYHPALMLAASHAAIKNKLKVVGARAESCTLGMMHGKHIAAVRHD